MVVILVVGAVVDGIPVVAVTLSGVQIPAVDAIPETGLTATVLMTDMQWAFRMVSMREPAAA